MAKKEFEGFNHGTGQIVLKNHTHIQTLRPSEIHLKENGTKDEKPSFAIVMISPYTPVTYVGEVSLKMLNEGLNELGYEIKKLN